MARAAKRRGDRRIPLGPAGRLADRPADQGPPERYQHGDVIRNEPGEDAGVFHRRVTTQSALDRYLSRGQIGRRQFDAGAKLYRLWRAAGGVQRVTLSYELRIPSGRELSDDQAALRRRLTEVLGAMGRSAASWCTSASATRRRGPGRRRAAIRRKPGSWCCAWRWTHSATTGSCEHLA